jgi:tetratricopeptide (TPR) repeat protein
MPDKPVVTISSTARDLPGYRDAAKDVCLRLGMFPKMMEHLPALDADAVRASLDMVDEAKVYVCILAHRYGSVPSGEDKSYTEIEYDRAVERGIPRLVFVMDRKHPVPADEVETGPGAEKLAKFKEKVGGERVGEFFTTPDSLRAHLMQSLSALQRKLDGETPSDAVVASLHYISDIPEAPEPYIAHPYTLMETHRLIGRKGELELLTDWATGVGPGAVSNTRVLSTIAVGGMGKSALTWKWFNDIAPQEISPLAGRVWWSFYESASGFDHFVTRTLAYVSGTSVEEVKQDPLPIREQKLLAVLDSKPFVVVLDGLERILTAYARMDAAYMQNADLDDETANIVAGAYGLPDSAGQSFVGRHALRRAVDPHVGQFLRRLTRLRASRILISSRLYPAELQTPMGGPLPGCYAVFLPGLSESDALELWRAFGARGSRETMLPVFRSFDSHPLLIQLLAYEVACFGTDPGNFDAWCEANPDFDPFDLPLVQVQSHVLAASLRGLGAAERRALHVIAGFRAPANMEALKGLLIRTKEDDDPDKVPYATLAGLDAGLTELEDRGLLGWDRRANRYDLHPIVRGVTWHGLDEAARNDLYTTLHAHFEAMPMVRDWQKVESLEDLTPAIELYDKLIGLERYDDAFVIFRDRIEDATLYRLSASRQRVELLKRLFPDGTAALPRLRSAWTQSWILNALAQGYWFSGGPGAAVAVFRRALEIDRQENNRINIAISLYSLSYVLRLSARLRAAEPAAREALLLARSQSNAAEEATSALVLGLTLAAHGVEDSAQAALRRALRLDTEHALPQGQGVVHAYLAEVALWRGDPAAARGLADRAWQLAVVERHEADFIRAARLQGAAALGFGDLDVANERLRHALTRARACNRVEEELPTLVALAELHRRRGELDAARELLDDLWDAAEAGPYPTFHADALNVLAQIERDAGNEEAAVAAATRAYELSWCDGPPFAWHWGLQAARKHLSELGAPEPDLPPYDESKFDPMPEVEIDPPDEE